MDKKRVTVEMPADMIQYVDKWRAYLQSEHPEKAISRSDAVRHCIGLSLTSSLIPSSVTELIGDLKITGTMPDLRGGGGETEDQT